MLPDLPYEIEVRPGSRAIKTITMEGGFTLQPECERWIIENTKSELNWDFDVMRTDSDLEMILFKFADANTAMMFKLTWGGA